MGASGTARLRAPARNGPPENMMTTDIDIAGLKQQLELQNEEMARLRHDLGILQDKDEILRVQYAYGYFVDNRMFREMADLFSDEGSWMEIAGRGRYYGKERIHQFLLEVIGEGRWGLIRNEVFNHVQQQPIITVDPDRQRARARARAEVQGNSPPDTPYYMTADGSYENTYVKENGVWKLQSLEVAMTFYCSIPREDIFFQSTPESEKFPPDHPSQPVVEGIGRRFSKFHFPHPVAGYDLAVPASDSNPW